MKTGKYQNANPIAWILHLATFCLTSLFTHTTAQPKKPKRGTLARFERANNQKNFFSQGIHIIFVVCWEEVNLSPLGEEVFSNYRSLGFYTIPRGLGTQFQDNNI